MKHEASRIRLMELAGLIKEAGEGGDGDLYAFPYEPGARFEEGQYDQMTVDELRTAITEMDEDLPDGVDIYAYDYTQYKPSNFTGGARAKCIVIDLDEGGFVYSKQALDPDQLRTITLAALRTTPLYTNRGSNSLTDRGARDVKLQQFLSKIHYQVNEIKEVLADNYPTFTTTKMIRVADKAITPGTWTFTGKESGGKGVYVNVINKQTYAFDMAELQAMKTSNPNDIKISQ